MNKEKNTTPAIIRLLMKTPKYEVDRSGNDWAFTGLRYDTRLVAIPLNELFTKIGDTHLSFVVNGASLPSPDETGNFVRLHLTATYFAKDDNMHTTINTIHKTYVLRNYDLRVWNGREEILPEVYGSEMVKIAEQEKSLDIKPKQ